MSVELVRPADHDARERRLRLAAFAEAEGEREQAEHRRERGHQDRAEPPRPGERDRLDELHPVAAAQQVRVIDEQDRVVDDDPREHDAADEGLHAEDRCR